MSNVRSCYAFLPDSPDAKEHNTEAPKKPTKPAKN